MDSLEEEATPSAAAANPHKEVRVRTTVYNVVDINLQAQAFTAVVQFEATWVDPELDMVQKGSRG